MHRQKRARIRYNRVRRKGQRLNGRRYGGPIERWPAHPTDEQIRYWLRADVRWTREPDRRHWTSSGLRCAIRRNPGLANLCGYVAIPRSHPMSGGVHEGILRVHGGITYSRLEGAEWVFGFDCAQSGDIMPLLATIGSGLQSVRVIEHDCAYRTIAYVHREVEYLAVQLHLYAMFHNAKRKGILT
jgi:hypothetical protein